MKQIALLLLAVLLTSCATKARLEGQLESLVGHDANEIAAQFGYPVESSVAPNGNKVYVYKRERSYITPGSYQTYGKGKDRTTVEIEGQVVESWCKIYFEVGSKNEVVRWHLEGNACRQ